MIELNMEQIQGVLSITRKNKRNGGLSDVLINLVGNCSCASGVYCIEHKSGKRYIGSSVDIGKRWRSHMNLLNQGNHYSKSLQKDWDEFGAENFKFCIIEIVNDEKNLIDREQCWIDKYESYNKNKGYNSSPSALNCSGVRHTEETKRKWSEIHKGRVFSEEHKRKIGLANKGKKRTPEMIERHRQKLLGRKTPEEIKKKISEACKGRDGFKLSEEAKKKISEARKGKRTSSKLHPDDVLKIDERLKNGESSVSIAKDYKVSKRTILNVKHRVTFKDILEA